MKTLVRLIVLIAAAILLVAVGFWLGTRFAPPRQASEPAPAEDSPAQAEGRVKEKSTGLQAGEPASKAASETGAEPGSPAAPSALEKGKPAPATTAAPPPSPVALKDGGSPAPAVSRKPPPGTAEAPQAETGKKPPGPSPPSQAGPAPPRVPASAVPPEFAARPKPQAPGPAAALEEKNPLPVVTPEDLGKNDVFYSVQAGAFLGREPALDLLDRLKSKQYPAYLVSAWDDKRQLWHTVRVGRFTDLETARQAAETLSRRERINAYVYGIGSLEYDRPRAPEPPAPAPAAPVSKPPADKRE